MKYDAIRSVKSLFPITRFFFRNSRKWVTQFFYSNQQTTSSRAPGRITSPLMIVSTVSFFELINWKINLKIKFLGICKVYEEYLKKKTPTRATITYDISNLFEFIDDLKDLSMLVLDNVIFRKFRLKKLFFKNFLQQSFTYVPHNKQFVKESIFNLMNERIRER